MRRHISTCSPACWTAVRGVNCKRFACNWYFKSRSAGLHCCLMSKCLQPETWQAQQTKQVLLSPLLCYNSWENPVLSWHACQSTFYSEHSTIGLHICCALLLCHTIFRRCAVCNHRGCWFGQHSHSGQHSQICVLCDGITSRQHCTGTEYFTYS